MPLFKYIAYSLDGNPIQGKKYAENSEQLKQILKSEKLILNNFSIINKKKSTFFFNKRKLSNFQILNFTREIALMLDSGITIIKSLEIATESIDDPIFQEKMQKVKEEIQSGERISVALEKTNFFSVATISMLAVGEQSGEIITMLKKIADYNEKHLNYIIQGFLVLIEPLMGVILGIVVGTIVLALYLPMLNILNLVS